MQDDPRPAAVHDAVVVVSQAGSLAARPHQGGIGIGGARPLIALALVLRGGRTIGIEVALLEQLPARRGDDVTVYAGGRVFMPWEIETVRHGGNESTA